MLKWIAKFIIFVVAVYITAYFVPGITIIGIEGALIVSVVLGFLNTFVKPFAMMLSFPINMLTLGTFTIVINALMVHVCEMFVPMYLTVTGVKYALIYGVVVAIVSWILKFIFLRD